MDEIAGASALLAAALLLGLVGFQLALAAGAPLGRAAFGGAFRVLPPRLRVSSAVAAVVWALAVLLVLRRSGAAVWSPLEGPALVVAVWVLAGILVPALVLNLITPSRLERGVWAPVTAVLLACTVMVAVLDRG